MKRNNKNFIDMDSMHLNNEDIAILTTIDIMEKRYTSCDQTRKNKDHTDASENLTCLPQSLYSRSPCNH